MAKTMKTTKPAATVKLIEDTIKLLLELGMPMNEFTPRAKERIAMGFLALAGIQESLYDVQELKELKRLSARETLDYWNRHFGEKLKDSSYDDVRDDVNLLVLGGLAINTGDKVGAAKNDSTRAFTLHDEVFVLLQAFGNSDFEARTAKFKAGHRSLMEEIQRKRDLSKIVITLPDGFEVPTSNDAHNVLQKQIIEEFLPIYTQTPKLLYFGDASNRELHKDKEGLKEIGFFDLLHDELPDIVVIDESNGWIFLIEAYHSTGEWTEFRLLKIKRKLEHLKDRLIFVTAVSDKETFRKLAPSIAWETEVWISSIPEHMIHFNGHKFLGPYIIEK